MVGKAVQALFPIFGKIGPAREQPLILISVQRSQRGGGGNRISGVGIAVEKLDQLFRPVHERIMDFVADEHRSHRDHAAGQALGSGDDIRRHIEITGGEGRAETAKTGDHLVKDQQETVLVADFTKPLQISLRRDQHSGRTGHRLDDHGGDCGGIVKRGNTFQLVGKLGPVFRLAAAEGVAREVVCVRHMVDTRQQCAEHLAVGDDAAD